ncbi:MAG: hypothetical protein ABIT07_00120 [Ferruginibacter sp.]
MDYFVKRIDVNDLTETVGKLSKTGKANSNTTITFTKKNCVVSLPLGLLFQVNKEVYLSLILNEIIYWDTSNNYSKLILSDGHRFLISS